MHHRIKRSERSVSRPITSAFLTKPPSEHLKVYGRMNYVCIYLGIMFYSKRVEYNGGIIIINTSQKLWCIMLFFCFFVFFVETNESSTRKSRKITKKLCKDDPVHRNSWLVSLCSCLLISSRCCSWFLF